MQASAGLLVLCCDLCSGVMYKQLPHCQWISLDERGYPQSFQAIFELGNFLHRSEDDILEKDCMDDSWYVIHDNKGGRFQESAFHNERTLVI